MTATNVAAVAATLISGGAIAIAAALFKLGSTLGGLSESMDNLSANAAMMEQRLSRVETAVMGGTPGARSAGRSPRSHGGGW